jgi:hypothetical protein
MRELHIGGLEQRGLRVPAPPSEGQATSATIVAGQVYKSGYYLYDAGGRWKVNGVQYFLPQFGINNNTFYDGYYAGESTDINLWLNTAQSLAAKTLRIFVQLPSGGNTPTSHATIYNFARRAEARGMRLGVVMHNSNDFKMTRERRDWINGFITYFSNRGKLHLIAYVSAGMRSTTGVVAVTVMTTIQVI